MARPDRRGGDRTTPRDRARSRDREDDAAHRPGTALVAVAVATYVAARIVGTWELYFLAFAFLAAVGVCWVLVLATVRRLEVVRTRHSRAAGRRRSARALVPREERLAPARGSRSRWSTRPAISAAAIAPSRSRAWGRGRERVATSGPWPARRGIHRLPAQIVVGGGSAGPRPRTRRRLGDTSDLTVSPATRASRHVRPLRRRLARPRSAGGGRRRLPTIDASEFRGIRPHNPGEPLNRVDWKATAKTGTLMLREMEDAADGGVRRPAQARLRASSVSRRDQLRGGRAGRRVDRRLRASLRPPRHPAAARERVAADPSLAGRREPAPAAVDPGRGDPARVVSARSLSADARRRHPHDRTHAELDPRRPVALDRGLVRAATIACRRRACPSRRPRRRRPAQPAGSIGRRPELRRSLSAAGVHYLTVRRGDDLRAALSMRHRRPSRPRPMKSSRKLLYFASFVGLAATAASSSTASARRRIAPLLLAAVAAAALAAARRGSSIGARGPSPSSCSRSAPICCCACRCRSPPHVHGVGGQVGFIFEQLRAGARSLHARRSSPWTSPRGPASRVLVSLVGYAAIVGLAAFLALSLRKALPAIVIVLVVLGLRLHDRRRDESSSGRRSPFSCWPAACWCCRALCGASAGERRTRWRAPRRPRSRRCSRSLCSGRRRWRRAQPLAGLAHVGARRPRRARASASTGWRTTRAFLILRPTRG